MSLFIKFNASYTVGLFIYILLGGCGESERTSENQSRKANTYVTLFTPVSSGASGVSYINKLPEATPSMNYFAYPNIYNGGGVSVGDINNDGLSDIYFTSNFGDNKMYLNKGNLVFEDITRTSGLKGAWGWSNGTTMVDINNDGYLDIYVCRSGNVPVDKRKNELFINNGDLTFTEKAKEYGLDSESYTAQASFFDYDRDGDLDVYFANQPNTLLVGEKFETEKKGRNDLTTDKLLRNDKGTFVEVSRQAGLENNGIGFAHSASIADLNNDGWPDIYVSNDYSEHDYLYYNNGDGTFSEKMKESMRHISMFAMGSDIADINNDGWLDVMTVDMVAEDNYRIKTNMSGMNPEAFSNSVKNGFHYQYMTNTLQLNNGNGTFSEVSKIAGVANTDWSWAPLWADFDNDGYKDLFVTNGYRKDVRNNDYSKIKDSILREMVKQPTGHYEYIKKILNIMPEVPIKNYVYKNNGDLTFTEKRDAWGITEGSFSNGAAYADLDNDGDLDMVISNIDQPAIIYKNNADKMNDANYVRIQLQGDSSNLRALGARVVLKAGSEYQVVENFVSRGYISSVEDQLHFGLGKEKQVDSIWVHWPNGNVQLETNIPINSLSTISYKEMQKVPVARIHSKNGDAHFKDITSMIGDSYVHQENTFDDFEREILLPHKMSTLGPGMAVGDVNGDGLDDFYIGAARGFVGAIFMQTQEGKFNKSTSSPWTADKQSEDIDAVFFDAEGDGDLDLYVVSGGNEVEEGSIHLQDRLYLNDGKGIFKKTSQALPEMLVSGGVVRPADYDNDGDMDVFVGGRLVPGQYPKAARSYLLQNHQGVFTDVTESVIPNIKKVGLVTSALWTDYNNDGKEDLMVGGEWMPIEVYKNDGEVFVNVSDELGLQDTDGWWYSLAAGDFDGDGDKDYIAGNLGQNYKYQASPEAPFDIYYDDFDNNNTGDIVLSYREDGKAVPLRGRECSSQQMPFIKEKFKTYDAFAKADMQEIFGEEKLEKALHLQAKTFKSVYIENTGKGSWKLTPLPSIAQISAINGMVVRDFNKDGHLDVVLAGNLYGSEVETPRNDAGNGLVMLGDGRGNFKTSTVKDTGFFAPFDAKEVHLINGITTSYIAVVNNSEKLQMFVLN